ncbi:hypothetical protein FPV67DRAFT_1560684 [Lyophyllum atratum]|nr:hypothetical protein FPV67DRAFT_1560684 [Lyophyllum atratum]
MSHWQSQAELQKDAAIFMKITHTALGLYASYEWCTSLSFEWDFITGKKKFRWPMIFYFSGRYLLLFALIGIKINCQALYVFVQVAGNAAIGVASINLSLHTMAVWSQDRYVVGVLFVAILGHWSLIFQGVLGNAIWAPGTGCLVTSTKKRIHSAASIYSACFDLLILLLNAYMILATTSKSCRRSKSSIISKIVFEEGLIFFITIFLFNLIAAVITGLDLNQIISVTFNVPAVVFSTTIASRLVRKLGSIDTCEPRS